MGQLIQNDITFNNVKLAGNSTVNMGQWPIILAGQQGPDEDGGIINAVDIDWNSAELNGETINTTGNLLSLVKNIDIKPNGSKNLLRRTSFESKEWIFGGQTITSESPWKTNFHGFNDNNFGTTSYYHQKYADSIINPTYDEREVPASNEAETDKPGTGNYNIDKYFYLINLIKYDEPNKNDEIRDFEWESDGDNRFMSFFQNLYTYDGKQYHCKLKPNTWYTLSFSIRGYNRQRTPGTTKVYTMIENCKQGESTNDVIVDGIKTTNQSGYNRWGWGPMSWNPITHHTYTFKTGSIIGQDNNYPALIFRPNDNANIEIGEVQLEEGKVATGWSESIEDINDHINTNNIYILGLINKLENRILALEKDGDTDLNPDEENPDNPDDSGTVSEKHLYVAYGKISTLGNSVNDILITDSSNWKGRRDMYLNFMSTLDGIDNTHFFNTFTGGGDTHLAPSDDILYFHKINSSDTEKIKTVELIIPQYSTTDYKWCLLIPYSYLQDLKIRINYNSSKGYIDYIDLTSYHFLDQRSSNQIGYINTTDYQYHDRYTYTPIITYAHYISKDINYNINYILIQFNKTVNSVSLTYSYDF